MHAGAREILELWFGSSDVRADADPAKRVLWWGGGPALDAEIRERFGALHARALAGELDGWADTPPGRLALIVLLDQLSRNIHRGRAGAFAGDGAAQRHALAAIAAGEDRALGPDQRGFLYMPLEHAEDLALQERSVALFTALAADLPPERQAAGETLVDFARRHRDIVARFGRFPYRNAVLGRESTPEERAWLATDPETFGQGAP